MCKVVPEVLGANITFAVRARFVLLRDLGSALSPANAFNIIQGLETLPLRVRQSQENAAKVAKHLANKKGVSGLFIQATKKASTKKELESI